MTRASLSLFFAVAAAALLGAAIATAQGGSTVDGRISSVLQNQPVSKAIVTIRPDSSARAAAPQGVVVKKGTGPGPASDIWVAESGGDGRFKFVDVPPGDYVISVRRTGYQTGTPGHFATAADLPPVHVKAGQNVSGVDVRLTPTAAVSGRVVDSDGDPVRGGQVQLMRYAWSQGKKRLVTADGGQIDDRGEYRLHGVSPGSYFLRAIPQDMTRMMGMAGQMGGQGRPNAQPVTGLGSSYYPDARDTERATELYLSPGSELKGMDIRVNTITLHSIRGTYPVSADTSVQVRAVNRDGEMGGMAFMNYVDSVYINAEIQAQVQLAVAQAQLSADLARISLPNMPNNPNAPQPGTFLISNLAPGKYQLIATQVKRQQPGNRAVDRQAQQDQDPPLQAHQEVEITNRDLDGVVITFAPPVKIKGTVQFEGKDEPAANQRNNIFFNDADGNSNTNAVLKKDNSFEASLAPGKYRVRFNGNQPAYVKSIKVGDKEAPDQVIDPATVNGPVTILLSNNFGAVEGTVTDADGKPVYNADVTFFGDQNKADWGDRFRSVMTNTSGRFAANNLMPGEYRVYAWVGVENGAPQNPDFRKPYEAQAVTVKIGPGESQKVELKSIH
jgi:protocatechuate 3,4-dioxygenase beta subunit